MTKHELKNLLSGTGKTEYTNLIQTISRYLAAGKTTGKETANTKRTKKEGTELVTGYINFSFPKYLLKAMCVSQGTLRFSNTKPIILFTAQDRL